MKELSPQELPLGLVGEDREGTLEHSFGLLPTSHAVTPRKYLLTKLWLDPKGQRSSRVPIP